MEQPACNGLMDGTYLFASIYYESGRLCSHGTVPMCRAASSKSRRKMTHQVSKKLRIFCDPHGMSRVDGALNYSNIVNCMRLLQSDGNLLSHFRIELKLGGAEFRKFRSNFCRFSKPRISSFHWINESMEAILVRVIEFYLISLAIFADDRKPE